MLPPTSTEVSDSGTNGVAADKKHAKLCLVDELREEQRSKHLGSWPQQKFTCLNVLETHGDGFAVL